MVLFYYLCVPNKSFYLFFNYIPLENFYLTDAYGLNEPVLEDPNPINNVTRLGGKKPAVFLRLKFVMSSLEF